MAEILEFMFKPELAHPPLPSTVGSRQASCQQTVEGHADYRSMEQVHKYKRKHSIPFLFYKIIG